MATLLRRIRRKPLIVPLSSSVVKRALVSMPLIVATTTATSTTSIVIVVAIVTPAATSTAIKSIVVSTAAPAIAATTTAMLVRWSSALPRINNGRNGLFARGQFAVAQKFLVFARVTIAKQLFAFAQELDVLGGQMVDLAIGVDHVVMVVCVCACVGWKRVCVVERCGFNSSNRWPTAS